VHAASYLPSRTSRLAGVRPPRYPSTHLSREATHRYPSAPQTSRRQFASAQASRR
jgi:hypothetical protein